MLNLLICTNCPCYAQIMWLNSHEWRKEAALTWAVTSNMNRPNATSLLVRRDFYSSWRWVPVRRRLRKASPDWVCRRFANCNNCKQYWCQNNWQGNTKHLDERGGYYLVSYWSQETHMDYSKVERRAPLIPSFLFESQPNSGNNRSMCLLLDCLTLEKETDVPKHQLTTTSQNIPQERKPQHSCVWNDPGLTRLSTC
jgi:hypothetical protein